jgi:hypothetical protein
MKAEKSRSVRKGQPSRHLVDLYRNGKRILRVGVFDAEDLLEIMWQGPGAMVADQIAIAADAFKSASTVNPITGEPWGPGGMQRAAQEDLALHRGLVDEEIYLACWRRDGTSHIASMPYTHDTKRRRVKWAPIDTHSDMTGMTGRFPHVARDAFAQQTVIDAAIEQLGPPPDDVDLDAVAQQCAVEWVLTLPPSIVVIEGPKGPGLRVGHPPLRNDPGV